MDELADLTNAKPDREGAVPSSGEIERQRKRLRSRRCAETRQHFTAKPPATDTATCTTTPPSVTTCVRAGALVPPHPAWVEVSHGWVPVNSHSTPVLTSIRRLWVARYTETTERSRHDNQRAQQSSRNAEVPQFFLFSLSFFLFFVCLFSFAFYVVFFLFPFFQSSELTPKRENKIVEKFLL